jgi:hypothetical protein
MGTAISVSRSGGLQFNASLGKKFRTPHFKISWCGGVHLPSQPCGSLRSGGSRFQSRQNPISRKQIWACLSSQLGKKHKIGILLSWVKSKTLSQNIASEKRAGNMTQAVERLPSKYEALSSSTSTAKKKKLNISQV